MIHARSASRRIDGRKYRQKQCCRKYAQGHENEQQPADQHAELTVRLHDPLGESQQHLDLVVGEREQETARDPNRPEFHLWRNNLQYRPVEPIVPSGTESPSEDDEEGDRCVYQNKYIRRVHNVPFFGF